MFCSLLHAKRIVYHIELVKPDPFRSLVPQILWSQGAYRLEIISVVPIVAKVFEKMIASQLNIFWSTTICYILFREPIGMGGRRTRF